MRCCVWRRSSGKLESACLPADCDMRVCEAGPLQNVRPLCLDHHCGSLLAGLQRQHPHFYAVRFGLELGLPSVEPEQQ